MPDAERATVDAFRTRARRRRARPGGLRDLAAARRPHGRGAQADRLRAAAGRRLATVLSYAPLPGAGDSDSRRGLRPWGGSSIVLAVALAVAGCGDSGLTEGGEGGDVTVTNHPALLFSPPWIAAAGPEAVREERRATSSRSSAPRAAGPRSATSSAAGCRSARSRPPPRSPRSRPARTSGSSAAASPRSKDVLLGHAPGLQARLDRGPEGQGGRLHEPRVRDAGAARAVARALRGRRRQRQDALDGRPHRGADRAQERRHRRGGDPRAGLLRAGRGGGLEAGLPGLRLRARVPLHGDHHRARRAREGPRARREDDRRARRGHRVPQAPTPRRSRRRGPRRRRSSRPARSRRCRRSIPRSTGSSASTSPRRSRRWPRRCA